MKRKLILLTLVICGLISGCKKSSDIEIVQETSEQTEAQSENTSEEPTSEEEQKSVTQKYGRSMKTLEIGNSKIEYPEVVHMENGNYMEKTNQTIMTDIEGALDYFGISENSANVLEAEMDNYYVTDDEKLLSIIFLGNFTPESGETKEVRFTVNINLENGENYRLAERADIDKLAEILEGSDDFRVVNTDEEIRPKQKSHIQSYTRQRLTQMLQDADFTIDENGKAVYPEVFSSLGSSSSYLEIGVEVPDNIGSHAEYLVDKSVLTAGI